MALGSGPPQLVCRGLGNPLLGALGPVERSAGLVLQLLGAFANNPLALLLAGGLLMYLLGLLLDLNLLGWLPQLPPHRPPPLLLTSSLALQPMLLLLARVPMLRLYQPIAV